MQKLYVEKKACRWHLAVIDNGKPTFGIITACRDVAVAFIMDANINRVEIKEIKNDKGTDCIVCR